MTTYRKTYSLRVASVLLLLLGGAALYFGHYNPAIRSLAGVAIVASMYLLRISRRSGSLAAGVPTDSKAAWRPARWLGILSIALLLLLGVSLLSLYIDELHGGQEVWPVYMFGVVVLAGSVVWSYLIWRKLFRR